MPSTSCSCRVAGHELSRSRTRAPDTETEKKKRGQRLFYASVGSVIIWFCASICFMVCIDTKLVEMNEANELFNKNISALVVARTKGMGEKTSLQIPAPVEAEAEQKKTQSQVGAEAGLPQFPVNHRPAAGRFRPPSDAAIRQCHKALWHTVDTTTSVLPRNETFVITGDIRDLWLRDSAAQVHPLLLPAVYRGRSLVQEDARLERVVSGLILKTARLIRFDPYANAFHRDRRTPATQFEREELGRHGYIATWNYELDSACYFMRMLYFFYVSFPSHPVLREREVREAVAIMVDVWMAEQLHEEDAYPTGELFDCLHCGKPYRYNPAELENGKGTATNASAGLTWSGFRPSDDPCVYGYIIPSNMFAVVVLGYMVKLSEVLWEDESLAKKARQLRAEIDDGIKNHGIVKHKVHGEIYAYEVDGLGHSLLIDDANVPSLLSIPYLGYEYDEAIFANTKRFILSKLNPWYHQGKSDGVAYEGIGSPHTKYIPQSIWPMAMIMEGLISKDATVKINLVEKLLAASAGTGWMHESFAANNPKRFSRPWFCWPDSLFSELVMSLTEECPKPKYGQYKVMEWKDKFVEGSAFSFIEKGREEEGEEQGKGKRERKGKGKRSRPKQSQPKQSLDWDLANQFLRKQSLRKQSLPKQSLPKQSLPKQSLLKQTLPKQSLAVISACIPGKRFTPEYIDASLANKQAFCDKWGATCILSREKHDTENPTYSAKWEKLHLVNHTQHTIDTDWIMWLDCDAAFTNLGIDWQMHLHGHLDNSKVLLTSTDRNGINLGVMFVPNNKLAHQFIDELYETRHYVEKNPNIKEWKDQAALDRLVEKQPKWSQLVDSTIPQEKINSYLDNRDGHTWKPSEWIAHQVWCQNIKECSRRFLSVLKNVKP